MNAAAWAPTLTRRDLLAGAAGLAAAPFLPRPAPAAPPRPSGYPFSLGVASGDPQPDGFLIWTRLAPEPLTGGGMPARPVPVAWEVAADERMRRVAQKGVATAVPEHAHSVHVELRGLDPDRWYWYRFRAGGETSTVGRTRTAARQRRARSPPPVRLPVVPALRAGLLRGVSPSPRRRPGPGRLPRRLHLRGAVLGRRRCAVTRARAHDARGVPEPARAPQDRPGPAGGARRVPVDAHVGRPRGAERLRGRLSRRTGPTRRRSCAGAAPRTRRTGSTCRCAGPRCRAARRCASTIGSRSATSWR